MHKSACRPGATLESDQVIQSALPQLPEAYVPDVACVQAICTRLRRMDEPLQVVQIVGDPGQGEQPHFRKSIRTVNSQCRAGVRQVAKMCCPRRQADDGYSGCEARCYDAPLDNRVLCIIPGVSFRFLYHRQPHMLERKQCFLLLSSRKSRQLTSSHA